VTACSTFSDAKLWNEDAELKAAVVAAIAPDVKLPDIPPHIVKCVQGAQLAKQPAKQKGKTKQAKAKPKTKDVPKDAPVQTVEGQKQAPSADVLVLAAVKDKAERRKCAQALIAWYRGVQKANKGPKVAEAKK